MRVLFATYSSAFQNPGGGEIVLLSLSRELQQLGHKVELYNPWAHQFSAFDRIHYFSSIETSFWNCAKLRAPAVPLVVTPTTNFSETLISKAKKFISKKAGDWIDGSLDRWTDFKRPDVWLPSTDVEAEGLTSQWNIPESKIRVLTNGIDKTFFNSTPLLFQEKYGTKEDFVLHVGRFHPVKNQLQLIRCLNGLGARAYFIGGPDLAHEEYYKTCLAEAKKSGGKIIFISALKHDDPLLASAYAAAKVFACPSFFETFGIAALEAAASGCEVVMTEHTRAKEIFEKACTFVDPQSPSDITEKISAALKRKANKEDRQILLQDYTWPVIAKRLSKIYEDL